MSITFIDFFAGIGGFRRGMELAGHKCVGFCEFDKYAVASYTSMHLMTDEQREYIESIELPTKKDGSYNFRNRQQEILKEEYKNGEWYANDVRRVDATSMPRADCWCFGFPCQDISVAGKQLGFRGHRSSLFYAVTGLIRDLEEKDRPKYLFIENVKNLLSVSGGGDFLKLLVELDEIGYDAEWQVLNSKDFGVPQNRERVFIIGHLRGRSTREVFPISGTTGENRVSVIGHRDGYRRNLQVFDKNGITETLDTCQGGGREPHIVEPSFIDMTIGGGVTTTDNARCLQARYNKGASKHKGEISGVAIPVLTPDRANKRQNGRRFKEDGEPMFTLTGQDRHGVAVSGVYTDATPRFQRPPLKDLNRCLKANQHDAGVVISVKEATKKGFAEAGVGDSINLEQPNSKTRRGRVGKGVSQTLTTGCQQGVVIKGGLQAHQQPRTDGLAPTLTSAMGCGGGQTPILRDGRDIRIRKLTPRECFRLQGWEDEYFNRAAMVNSDSQLYKQAGNGVTVNVIQAIAERIE